MAQVVFSLLQIKDIHPPTVDADDRSHRVQVKQAEPATLLPSQREFNLISNHQNIHALLQCHRYSIAKDDNEEGGKDTTVVDCASASYREFSVKDTPVQNLLFLAR